MPPVFPRAPVARDLPYECTPPRRRVGGRGPDEAPPPLRHEDSFYEVQDGGALTEHKDLVVHLGGSRNDFEENHHLWRTHVQGRYALDIEAGASTVNVGGILEGRVSVRGREVMQWSSMTVCAMNLHKSSRPSKGAVTKHTVQTRIVSASEAIYQASIVESAAKKVQSPQLTPWAPQRPRHYASIEHANIH